MWECQVFPDITEAILQYGASFLKQLHQLAEQRKETNPFYEHAPLPWKCMCTRRRVYVNMTTGRSVDLQRILKQTRTILLQHKNTPSKSQRGNKSLEKQMLDVQVYILSLIIEQKRMHLVNNEILKDNTNIIQ